MAMRKNREPLTAEVQPEDYYDNELDKLLSELGDGVEIMGRVYRITSPVDAMGKPTTEAVGKIEEIVDEDFIGKTYGSGSYRIKYTLRQGKRTEYKTVTLHIGKEYDRFHQNRTPSALGTPTQSIGGGLDLGGILAGITTEKIAVFGAILEGVRKIFAPPQPQVDMTKLLEVMLTNNRQQSVSDAVLVKALDGMQRQNTPPTVAQQVAEYKALKDAFAEDFENSNEEKGDTMNFLLEKAFEYLPSLIQQKQNDFKAVGQSVKENPLVKSIINSNPELTKQFFKTAVEKYGVQAANELAAGFGYQVTQQAPEQPVNAEQ